MRCPPCQGVHAYLYLLSNAFKGYRYREKGKKLPGHLDTLDTGSEFERGIRHEIII
jgi:hypothetical protein